MKYKIQTTLLLFSLMISPLVMAKHIASVSYTKPINPAEIKIFQEIKSSGVAELVTAIINENFKLNAPIDIVFGGDDGPLFDPVKHEIIVPYYFIKEVEQRFTTDNYAETGVSEKDATLYALTHTLFHELGHALIAMYDLAIVGKEEDAADALATILLIEFFEQGQEIARSAADLFDLESNDIQEFEEVDFWDEHSLDAQRFYSTLCHIYGSDPKNYAEIPANYQFSEDRSDLCIAEYENLTLSWFKLLAPYTSTLN